jgi:hypothetical protein
MKFLQVPSLIILFVSISFLSCDDDNCIKGEGILETRTIALASFDKVSLLGVDHLTIKQGDIQEVKVTGYPNIIDQLNTNISNKAWEIRLKDGCYNNADMDIEITIPDLKAANLTGSGRIQVEEFTNQENQLFAISGSGDIEIAGNSGTKEVLFNITGSGNIVGTNNFTDLESVKLNISGSGDFDAFSMESLSYEVIISGSGNANVHPINQLTGVITGSGNINYLGTPEVNVSITGSGKVNNVN